MSSRTSSSSTLNLPSNKTFGLFFSVVFITLAAYFYWKTWITFAFIALIIAFTFLAFTFFAPQILSPLNRLWYRFGLLLGKIVSPIVLGILFFLLITPASIVTRLFGRDELKIKKRSVKSYWADRSQPSHPSDSFKNQF
jgi:hypothetical protein